MFVALQLVGVAVTPSKVTLLVPSLDPKFMPVIVTLVPTEPELGDKLLMPGGGITVKALPLLSTPPACTTTFPLVAVAGTGTAILRYQHSNARYGYLEFV